jgi:hypothetical protein
MADNPQELAVEIFMVGDEPHCIAGWDLKQRNAEFLDGFDTGYFEFLINTLADAEDEKRAALALRSTLHHSLETLFTLLCALSQAPHCVYAWISKCSTGPLRRLVETIGRGEPINGPWVTRPRGWSGLADIVFDRYMPNEEKGETTKRLLALLWQRLAREFLDPDHIDEYNSIKHGLRMRSGGFSLRVGVEHSYGVPPPQHEMSTIGHSEHGSSFFRLERVGAKDSRTFTTRRISLNWRLEKVILLCQLAAMSIENIVGVLRFLNGTPATDVRFVRPPDDADFDRPWTYSPGTTRIDMDFVFPPGTVPGLTKAELLDQIGKLRAQQDGK